MNQAHRVGGSSNGRQLPARGRAGTIGLYKPEGQRVHVHVLARVALVLGRKRRRTACVFVCALAALCVCVCVHIWCNVMCFTAPWWSRATLRFILRWCGEAAVQSGLPADVQRLLDSCHALNIFHFLLILCLPNPPAESFIAPSRRKTDLCLQMNVKIKFDKFDSRIALRKRDSGKNDFPCQIIPRASRKQGADLNSVDPVDGMFVAWWYNL